MYLLRNLLNVILIDVFFFAGSYYGTGTVLHECFVFCFKAYLGIKLLTSHHSCVSVKVPGLESRFPKVS